VYKNTGELDLDEYNSVIDPASYPANAPVGNASGGVDSSLTAANAWPWCVVPKPGTEAYAAEQGLPVCPSTVSYWRTADGSRWAVRGAINAGLAVYLYLQGLEKSAAPDPDYDQCELLGSPPGSE
jgi:hypothetical protein